MGLSLEEKQAMVSEVAAKLAGAQAVIVAGSARSMGVIVEGM